MEKSDFLSEDKNKVKKAILRGMCKCAEEVYEYYNTPFL